MVITLLTTGQKDEMKTAFTEEIVAVLHTNTETTAELYFGDYSCVVTKAYVTDIESDDRNWEEGIIKYKLVYNNGHMESDMSGRFIGKYLAHMANPEVHVQEKFDWIYTRLINKILLNNDCYQHYDELDY